MSETAYLPMNFGGIADEMFSAYETARVLILPVSYEGTGSFGSRTADGAMAIIEASRHMELYEEETDAEVYKIGIHTLEEFKSRETPELMMDDLYETTRKHLKSEKFLCIIGGEHSVSVPVIKANAEKFYDLSVLQIDAHADLHDTYDGSRCSQASTMSRVVKDWRIPAVQVGIRSISAEEVRLLETGLPTRIFWAKDIVGKIGWIDSAIDHLTENVYLTIDVSGLDPSLVPTIGTPEPGGLGWFETLALIRKLAEKRRIVGMDLVGYAYIENQNDPAFVCAKLVYKSLAYIFRNETPKIIGRN